MRIKRLDIRNIRSYEEASIEMPQGNVLFVGDIGSGKSSILMSIEFALFGLGDLDGGDLLRTGESSGHVRMDFESGKEEYTVFRSLERSKRGVRQKEGYIASGGVRTDYSPSELKQRILGILGFNENPGPRATSVIYRYAVFTPQEHMKSILHQASDRRMETLRKAFGIEEYSTAAGNAALLKSCLREDMKELQGRVHDYDEKKRELEEKRAAAERSRKEEKTISEALEPARKELEEVKAELVKMDAIRQEARRLEGEIPQMEKSIREKEDNSEQLVLDGKKSEQRAIEIGRAIKSLESVTKPENDRRFIEDKIEQLKEKLIALRERKTRISAKIEDYSRILEEGVCPVCDRESSGEEFRPKIDSMEKDLKAIEKDISLSGSGLEEAERELERIKHYERTSERLEELRKSLQELSEESSSRERRLQEYQESIRKDKDVLSAMREEMEKKKHVFSRFQQMNARKDRLEATNIGLTARLTSKKKETEMLQTRASEISKRVREMESLLEKLKMTRQRIAWMEEYFIPTVGDIERHVLMSINEEFNSIFTEILSMLIENGEISMRVDDDFNPVVEQDGYELSIEGLSGGERTSAALAYRLALNTMVRKTGRAGESNLLILDEPTDGFSKQQLFRLRDVLQETSSEQIILVSHEVELESFADTIFRVSKEGNVSRIEKT